MNHSVKKNEDAESSITLTSKLWSKKMKIPLVVSMLPRFTVDTSVWKHWLEKTHITWIHEMKLIDRYDTNEDMSTAK